MSPNEAIRLALQQIQNDPSAAATAKHIGDRANRLFVEAQTDNEMLKAAGAMILTELEEMIGSGELVPDEEFPDQLTLKT